MRSAVSQYAGARPASPITMITKGGSRSLWLAAVAAAGATITLAVWSTVSDLVPLVTAARSGAEEVRKLSAGNLIDGEGDALDSLTAELALLQRESGPAAALARWTRRFSPALGWIPSLDREVASWAWRVEGFDRDFRLASEFLDTSRLLLETMDSAQQVLASPDEVWSPSELGAQVRNLEVSFASTLDSLEAASVGQRRYRPGIAIPWATEALTLAEEFEERLASGSLLGRRASSLLGDLLEVAERVQPLLGQLANGNDTDQMSIGKLREALAFVDERLQFALVKSDGLTGLASKGESNVYLRERIDLLQDLLRVLLAVNRATTVGLDALGPALDGGTALLGSDGILVGALDEVIQKRDEFSEAVSLLEGARQTVHRLELASAGQARLVPGLTDLSGVVDVLHGGLQLLTELAPIGAELAAADSRWRYLVLGQSADELRATGGFVSAIWLVTLENGALSDIRYHDTVLVDDTGNFVLYPPAPPGLEQHMSAHTWLMRDVSWEPDFPTTARTAADLFKIGQNEDVDGVVAIDQWSMLEMVRSLGSVPAPGGGEPITPRNFLEKLEVEWGRPPASYSELSEHFSVGPPPNRTCGFHRIRLSSG